MGNTACCATDVKNGQQDLKDPVSLPTGSKGADEKEEVVGGGSSIEWKIVLKKTKEVNKLGVDVDLTDGCSLLIDKVNDGLVGEWNKANPDKEVKKEDRIIGVNGSKGNAQALTEVCKKEDVLEMTVVRDARE
mmetsp:Transcript_62498/g.183219  ORF Transcript_62498/g.183219 Transcript_62498/m.183219 type:complete len:133 (+) Transcript_62498:68-466(+)